MFGQMDQRLERLLERADALWEAGKSLPFDLACELMSYGVDVEKLERMHKR
jgi:putative hemolysin